MSRFVATLLQGLNCLANPPGVGPFHSVSSLKVGKSFFSLLEMKFGNSSKEVSRKALAYRLRCRGLLAVGRVPGQGGKKRATFVSLARAVPQASAPLHSVFSFKVEIVSSVYLK
ncbi:hypothetical protein BHE17_02645 [Planococcus maritimus]|nr:hypothetical protein BHE17_02645 [Planococcus maritimus]